MCFVSQLKYLRSMFFRDIIEAMDKDCGFPLTKLRVDGKMTNSDLLLELQADISGIPVGEFL